MYANFLNYIIEINVFILVANLKTEERCQQRRSMEVRTIGCRYSRWYQDRSRKRDGHRARPGRQLDPTTRLSTQWWFQPSTRTVAYTPGGNLDQPSTRFVSARQLCRWVWLVDGGRGNSLLIDTRSTTTGPVKE